MNRFYMDTNVFLSELKPDDPYHSESKAIVRGLEVCQGKETRTFKDCLRG